MTTSNVACRHPRRGRPDEPPRKVADVAYLKVGFPAPPNRLGEKNRAPRTISTKGPNTFRFTGFRSRTWDDLSRANPGRLIGRALLLAAVFSWEVSGIAAEARSASPSIAKATLAAVETGTSAPPSPAAASPASVTAAPASPAAGTLTPAPVAPSSPGGLPFPASSTTPSVPGAEPPAPGAATPAPGSSLAPGGTATAPAAAPAPSATPLDLAKQQQRAHLHRPGTDVDADVVTGSLASNIFILKGNVTLHSDPKIDREIADASESDDPLTVTADEIDIDKLAFTYVAKGHVHFVQGDRSGRADTAMLDQQNHTLDLIGNADVLDGDHRAAAAKMHYNTLDKQFLGSGNVRIYEPLPTPDPNAKPTPPPKHKRRFPI